MLGGFGDLCFERHSRSDVKEEPQNATPFVRGIRDVTKVSTIMNEVSCGYVKSQLLIDDYPGEGIQ